MIQMAISRPGNMGTAPLHLMSQQGFGRDLPVPGIRAISNLKICQLDRIPAFYHIDVYSLSFISSPFHQKVMQRGTQGELAMEKHYQLTGC